MVRGLSNIIQKFQNNLTCPICRTPFIKEDITTNYAMQEVIEEVVQINKKRKRGYDKCNDGCVCARNKAIELQVQM